jgi:acyl-CoA synthetase (AMP-forming)/AMP-acid ligase II
MPGYHRQPQLTEAAIVDGWLHTGDLGFVDAEGFLHLVDRRKDLIISGGVNVYPRDIEEVAAHHPAVSEVAVFGVPDSRWGECPVAAVVLRPDARVDAAELRDWINANVSARFQRIRGYRYCRICRATSPARPSSANCARLIWPPLWIEPAQRAGASMALHPAPAFPCRCLFRIDRIAVPACAGLRGLPPRPWKRRGRAPPLCFPSGCDPRQKS